MSRTRLVAISLVADALDTIVLGQLPGLSWFIDIPTILVHLVFAGPIALLTLGELAPVVGTLPLFTAAALLYKPRVKA